MTSAEPLYNHKIIHVCGYARGGTNIAWNIIQSHPQICSPIYETGKLLKKSPRLWLMVRTHKVLPTGLVRTVVDRELYRFKLMNLANAQNRYLDETTIYQPTQVARSVLCLKSVNYDAGINDLLARVYPELYVIGIARHGLALCDSYLRRGRSVREAAQVYQDLADRLAGFAASPRIRYRLFRFEDLLDEPFARAAEIFGFVAVEPGRIDKLRLKMKRVVTADGSHVVTAGCENVKYWYDRQEIGQVLARDVNQRQIDRLSPDDVAVFRARAARALAYFGYQ